MTIETSVLLMFVSLVVLIFTGLPLAFVLGGLALVFAYFLWGPQSMLLIAVQSWGVMTSYFLVAIPLYVFMASILQRSGIVEDLFEFMQMWFGPLRGGLAIGTVVICTLMAAMTGIVGAAVATMGILALPAMLKRGYDKRIAVGSICAGGTLGILIPPSVITIVYAVTAGVSIGHMFMGGVFPGLLLSSLFIIYIAIRCWFNPELGPAPPKEERDRHSMKDKVLALRTVILPILLIVGVLGSIYAGIATPTEAAGVGCIGAIISAIIYRRLTLDMIKDAVKTTAIVSSMIMWITIGARCYISVVSAIGGDELIQGFVLHLTGNRWVILIVMQVILLVLGLFLDEIGIILLCVPIFLPIVTSVGFDPVWFGILFLVNAQMNYITPPFGYTLFYMKGVAPKEVTMGHIYRGAIPFVLLQLLGLILCALFPQIILWLPHMMK
jgi:tripartite ATP-independent transporter DctM subunit